MTLEEKFLACEQLLPILQEFRTTGSAKFEWEKQELLRKVYPTIFNVTSMHLSCATCVRQYLEMLASWYEREHGKYVVAQQPVTTEAKKKTPKKKTS